MPKVSTPFKTVLVGCGGMGRYHASTANSLPEYEVTALCDIAEPMMQHALEMFPQAARYTDFHKMLAEQKPDVVIIGTGNESHAGLTIAAVEAGARGVFCEKPMAVDMGEALAMTTACREHGAVLMINHQRRQFPVFAAMQRLMEEGAIGQVRLLRGTCFGDVLSDGTHLIDTMRFLTGDREVKWVLGQVCRDTPNPAEPKSHGFKASGGWRYGHPIESGAFAVFEFEHGLRAEIMTGSLHEKGRKYGDYVVIGTEGRLHYAGDSVDPPLTIQDGQAGGWRAVPFEMPDWEPIAQANFQGLTRMILEGADHPMSGASALKDMEIVMAVYESARRRAKITLPLNEQRFPLAIMVEEGQL